MTNIQKLIENSKQNKIYLKIVQIKCQSIIRKRNALEYLVIDLGDYTILTIIEIWLTTSDNFEIWNLPPTIHCCF